MLSLSLSSSALFLSPPRLCLLLASGRSFQPDRLSFSPIRRWKARGMRSGPSISFDLVAVIFFQILLFPSNSIIRPNGRNKKRGRRSSVRPSARGFSCDCIREIVIYVWRHCVAGYPAEGSERSSRENCPLRCDPANRVFPVCHPLFREPSLEPIERHNKTRRWLPVKHEACIDRWGFFQAFVSRCLFCHLVLLLLRFRRSIAHACDSKVEINELILRDIIKTIGYKLISS